MRIVKSEFAARALLVAGSCVAAVVLLELPALVHAVNYRDLMDGNPLHSNNIEDPELLQIHRPHSRMTGSSTGGFAAKVYDVPLAEQTSYHWDAQYDQNGFRNAVDLKSADTVVLGDSFVEGTTIPEAQLMASMLTNPRGKVVANLGQNGYGPQQELVVLRRYAIPLHPQTAIWVFSEATDILDAAQYLVLTRRLSDFWPAFLDRSFTKNALKRLRPQKKGAPAVTGSGILHDTNGAHNTYFTFGDAFSSLDLPKLEPTGLDETRRTLTAASDLCTAHGCRLIFVFAPDKFRALHEFCTFPPESDWRNSKLNDLPERMAQMVHSISPGIGYLDLTPALVADIKSGAMPYAIDDGHWNAEGQRVAAKAINEYLANENSVASADPRGASKP
jgi:hypothetical protein